MKCIVANKTDITVPFFDCDPMAICWHGHYAKYLELARCELFDKIDYGYIKMRDSGYSWPIIELQIRYVQPVVYEQQLVIESGLVEYENYVRIDYEITDKQSAKRLTKATTKQVAVRLANNEMQIISPEILREKLAAYL